MKKKILTCIPFCVVMRVEVGQTVVALKDGLSRPSNIQSGRIKAVVCQIKIAYCCSGGWQFTIAIRGILVYVNAFIQQGFSQASLLSFFYADNTSIMSYYLWCENVMNNSSSFASRQCAGFVCLYQGFKCFEIIFWHPGLFICFCCQFSCPAYYANLFGQSKLAEQLSNLGFLSGFHVTNIHSRICQFGMKSFLTILFCFVLFFFVWLLKTTSRKP